MLLIPTNSQQFPLIHNDSHYSPLTPHKGMTRLRGNETPAPPWKCQKNAIPAPFRMCQVSMERTRMSLSTALSNRATASRTLASNSDIRNSQPFTENAPRDRLDNAMESTRFNLSIAPPNRGRRAANQHLPRKSHTQYCPESGAHLPCPGGLTVSRRKLRSLTGEGACPPVNLIPSGSFLEIL